MNLSWIGYGLAVTWAVGALTLRTQLNRSSPFVHALNRALALIALITFVWGIVVIPLARAVSVMAEVASVPTGERPQHIYEAIVGWGWAFVLSLPALFLFAAFSMWVFRWFHRRAPSAPSG